MSDENEVFNSFFADTYQNDQLDKRMTLSNTKSIIRTVSLSDISTQVISYPDGSGFSSLER